MKAILILALFVALLASGCGSGYGGNNKKPSGGTTTNLGPGY
jgi:uncharacterized protein YceK